MDKPGYINIQFICKYIYNTKSTFCPWIIIQLFQLQKSVFFCFKIINMFKCVSSLTFCEMSLPAIKSVCLMKNTFCKWIIFKIFILCIYLCFDVYNVSSVTFCEISLPAIKTACLVTSTICQWIIVQIFQLRFLFVF